MSDPENIIPSALKRLRGAKSKAEIARLCGIPQQSYNRYELGEIKPKYDALLKIATHYGLTVDEMLSDNCQAKETPNCIRDPPENYLSLLGPDLTRKMVLEYAETALAESSRLGRSGQFETLMLHLARIADPDQGSWHANQAKSIIDTLQEGKKP